MKLDFKKKPAAVLFLIFFVSYSVVYATHIENEDITNSKHNLSITGPSPDSDVQRNVWNTDTDEICIFCHTPHGSNSATGIKPPIWNRFLSSASYTMYDQVWSHSFDGTLNQANTPTGYSRLCLSCHDGTIALGTVINTAGTGMYNTDVDNLILSFIIGGSPGAGGTMPAGSLTPAGDPSGDTRRLGTDMRNDHPVSFKYDTSMADYDGELVNPGAIPANTKRGTDDMIKPLKRFPGSDPAVADSVQCTSCHNPHNTAYPKFLRASLFQNAPTNDHPAGEQIICLFCHDKPGWEGSTDPDNELNTHALSTAIHAPYPPEAVSPGNPYDFDGEHSVAEYACRNCHDPHTIPGADRLHREGILATSGEASSEATCYLCHSPNSGGIELVAGDTPNPLFTSGNPAPDVYTQFTKELPEGGGGSAMSLSFGTGHQPVFTPNSTEGVELISPLPPVDNEDPKFLNDNVSVELAHVECVDCHNPHQVTGPRFSTAPNRMRGMKGIDIHGDVVGPGVTGNDRQVYIYEVCFRCHGNSYSQMFTGDAYPDNNNVFRSTDPNLPHFYPQNESAYGLPKAPANPKMSLSGFSNKRKEFALDSVGTAPGLDTLTYNSAFHPIAATGRNQSEALNNAFDPAAAILGLGVDSTIMCTDCHNTDDIGDIKGPVTTSSPSTIRTGTGAGSLTGTDRNDILWNVGDDDVITNTTGAVGPHGSTNIRILRGIYNTRSSSDCTLDPGSSDDCRYIGQNTSVAIGQGGGGNPDMRLPYNNDFELCFRCHDRRIFIDGTSDKTNFYGRYTSIANDTKFTFAISPPPQGDSLWQGNLHYLHINYSDAKCHDCHNNVHSNIEAPNTIYGNDNGICTDDGQGTFINGLRAHDACYQDPGVEKGLVPDYNPQDDGPIGNCDFGDPENSCNRTATHLVNFNPISVTGNQSSKPRWFYGFNKWQKDDELNNPAQKYMNCDVRCHNRVMNECAYQYELIPNIVGGVTKFTGCVK